MEMTKQLYRTLSHKIFSMTLKLGLIYFISETRLNLSETGDKLDLRRYLKVSPMH